MGERGNMRSIIRSAFCFCCSVRIRLLAASIVFGFLLPVHSHAGAVQDRSVDFNIPSQTLAGALQAFITQSNLQLLYAADLVEGKTAPAIVGQYTVVEALQRLLTESGLV